MLIIVLFFAGHWALAAFFQSFFLHRYGAHRQFELSPFWERVFYLGTFIFQGSSFLVPRAYAIMHREHHAFSDTERDPHSPRVHGNPLRMMWKTKEHYGGLVRRTRPFEARFDGGYPEWQMLDRIGDHWGTRVAWGTLCTLFYLAFAPHPAFFLLLPVHYLMGPVHGVIVNWCGHRYGYRNFDSSDASRNTLPIDVLVLGELFQNNHHRFGQAPNFAVRRFEVDPTYLVIRLLAALRIVRFAAPPQRAVLAAAA